MSCLWHHVDRYNLPGLDVVMLAIVWTEAIEGGVTDLQVQHLVAKAISTFVDTMCHPLLSTFPGLQHI